MPNFKKIDMVRLKISDWVKQVIAMLAILCSLVFNCDALTFDRLNACGDVATMLALLQGDADIKCRPFIGALERSLVKRLDPLGNQNLCFLAKPPTPSYASYSCLFTKKNGSAELLCIRATSAGDIDDYIENYPNKYGSQVKQYQDEARDCESSNKIVSAAQLTLVPIQVHTIARYQFGYVMGLGQTDPATATFMQGFAIVDPELTLPKPTAIEFTYMLSGGISPVDVKQRKNANAKSAGDWTVYLDDSQFKKIIDETMQLTKGKANIIFQSLDIERQTSPARSQQDKTNLKTKWKRSAAQFFSDEGFETMSSAEFKAATGITISELDEQINKSIPYGLRDSGLRTKSEGPLILINPPSQQCVVQGGLMIAIVFGSKPQIHINKDFGGLGIGLIGIGPCSRSSGAVRRYMDSLVAETVDGVLEQIGKTK